MSIADDHITGSPDNSDEYDEMIDALDELIEYGLLKSVGDGRIKNEQKAKLRTQYMKEVRQAVKEKRQVLKQQRLEEYADVIEELEASGILES